MVSLEEYKKAYRELKIERSKKAFIVHLVVYVLFNIMFIIENLINTPNNIWFIYPLIGWGTGLFFHYLFGVRWINSRIDRLEAIVEAKARKRK